MPVIVLGFYGARDNTSRLLRDRDELVLDVVVERIAAHLDPVRVQVAFVVDAVRLGKLDVEDEAALRTALVSALAATPQTTGIAFVRSDLRVTRYNRLDYRIYDDVDVARIPNGRSHLDAARSGAEPSWIGPVWSDPLDQRILQFRAPLVGAGGEFRGVLVAAVSIMDLSRYLGEIEDDLGQTPFVLTGQEQVVAHPLLASTAVSSRFGSAQPLPHISVFPDRYLASIWARPLNALNASVPFRRSRGHWNWVPGGGYEAHTYLYRAMTGYGEMPWLVGFHYPGIETRRARWIVAGIGVGG
ncbi:cache domain-containing protein, partial [uncultured Enterovirga sp.]|uniref:cache domain-containing protein n=1 Tax=uncultured Enterovirga sp. TaxID=2026352 RepID=UPI0035CB45EE